MQRKIISLLMALGVVLSVSAAPSGGAAQSHALVRLLNSRAAGAPATYAAAAKEVVADAKAGKPLQTYVVAILSREPDAPPELRIDAATREKYFAATRNRIEDLAQRTNNSLAWYLIALDTGDTNLLRRAAFGGNVQALNAWGAFLVSQAAATATSTNEVVTAFAEAYDCFSRAAGAGDANGLYNLGMSYARGLGVPRDDNRAFDCFRAAAEQGHPEAINNIGWFFREGRGVEKDVALSAKWFAKSAGYRNPFGQFNYALALQRGEGVPQDDEKAAWLLKAAAEGGCVEAMDAWGVALCKGRGVKQDARAGVAQFRRAARAGFPPAMENMATCYEQGTGVEKDSSRATVWKIRSRAARGDRNAQAWLQQNAPKDD